MSRCHVQGVESILYVLVFPPFIALSKNVGLQKFFINSFSPVLMMSHAEHNEMHHHNKDLSAYLSHFLPRQFLIQPFILAAFILPLSSAK